MKCDLALYKTTRIMKKIFYTKKVKKRQGLFISLARNTQTHLYNLLIMTSAQRFFLLPASNQTNSKRNFIKVVQSYVHWQFFLQMSG